jgi:hypothetical protein
MTQPEGGGPDDVETGLRLAAFVQQDGRERAVESEQLTYDDFVALRIELRDLLRRGPTIAGVRVTHVKPWLWRVATSRGTPLTTTGAATGYEVRLSRYATSQVE